MTASVSMMTYLSIDDRFNNLSQTHFTLIIIFIINLLNLFNEYYYEFITLTSLAIEVNLCFINLRFLKLK